MGGAPWDPRGTYGHTLVDSNPVTFKGTEDQLAAETKPEYDFIYGDAFNDFSVPWHLTTSEFTSDVKKLLDPERGVFLANIIDIYPRFEAPARDELIDVVQRLEHGGLDLDASPIKRWLRDDPAASKVIAGPGIASVMLRPGFPQDGALDRKLVLRAVLDTATEALRLAGLHSSNRNWTDR